MAKPKTPNQKRKYGELNTRLAKYVTLIEEIYEQLNLEAAKLVGNNTDYNADSGKPFRWSDYPQTRKRIADIQRQFVEDIQTVIMRGTSEEWKNSNEVQDLLANAVLRSYDAQVNGEQYRIYYQENSDALEAFQERKDKGMNVSSKLWSQAADYKQGLEDAISCAIEKGTSAVTLSKQISRYLQDFPSLQKDYKQRFGKATRAKDCEYRSVRLAASEINMAYRQAENLRWQQMDFVVGYEIKLSGNHTCNGKPFHDICDELKGKYPKTFQWSGWHPLCYSDDSEVLTNRGWKLFKDVLDDDLILSLNPTDRTVEWVEFTDRQCYRHEGDMAHFFNKSLDCLVTPDHQMVYVNKSNGKLKKCSALEYTKGKGGFYRGCEYEGKDMDTISIGKTELSFDLFCEFMGYWLSDGSTIRKSQIVISQQDGEVAKPAIIACVSSMGFKPSCNYSTISFYDTDLCQYLKQFGRCITKYVPEQIKNASKRQIRIFLDAFVLCDGYKRPCKSFTGSHGNEFKSGKDEIMYFTTSERMAGDLSELILKYGHRPSFYVSKAGIAHKNGGYTIKSNYDCYAIRECYSTTATVFNKEMLHYDGLVYDLTLKKNHIMYIRRNGKCFWGSNCRCYKIPILKTEEEFWAWDGRGEATTESVNEVKDVPEGFKKWALDNRLRIDEAKGRGTLPYFLRDNKSAYQSISTETSVKEIIHKATAVGDEVQSVAERIASKNKGYVTPINFKSEDSILRKVRTEGITPYDIKDAVRTTIIVPQNKIEDTLQELSEETGFVRLKRQRPESFMGYSGNIVNIRTSNGLIAEIQVNTERMIYAKEKPDDAKKILGEKRWNEIRKQTGMEGGLGHKYYEEWREKDRASDEAQNIAQKSVEYYNHFR